MRALQTAIATVLWAALTVAGSEAALRVLMGQLSGPARAEQTAPATMNLPDPDLGARPNPKYSGHDSRGWRNPKALDRADIIAIGDSQTYGISARDDQTWPYRLGVLLGRPVYQMAFGGYSPVHALRLLPEALKLHPKRIIVGLYTGADYTNAFVSAYFDGPNPAIGALRSHDPKVLQDTKRAHHIDSGGWIRSRFLDCERPSPAPDIRLLSTSNILNLPPLATLVAKPFMSAYWPEVKKISVLARELDARISVARESESQLSPPYCIHYHDSDLQAGLAPAYRLLALDETDPRDVEGERLSVVALIAISKQVQLSVLMVPTKALVFRNRIEKRGLPEHSEHLTRLWKLETASRDRVMKAMTAAGVQVIDALPDLAAQADGGVDPYQGKSFNGHPSPVGYDTIANTVAKALQ